jgi:CDP-glycerol glycerophosphotransferase
MRRMARVSVVVPVYNVEPFLDECLRSIAGQTFADLEVVMVDDGSTDASVAIAERFAAGDRRFRLIAQPNAGLGAARNTGLDAATGEHVAFVDSDDVLPPDAYERLLGSLERTGSDFATGNVHRVSSRGCTQAGFLAQAFTASRPRAHVRAFAALLSDRTACNKLWRRSFWDGLGLRFPEGVLHEDIALVMRAHHAAEAVDVLAAPVYLYRTRETGEPSITQRRHELRALRDRLAAVEEVHALLRATESARHLRRYEHSVVAADLRYHLDLLEVAGDDYRALFLQAANAFLDRAHRGVCHGLPALERLKWELVRRRALPELLEILRFQREDTLRTPPVRRLGRCSGDFPFRDDPRLRLPRSAFRLGRRDPELSLTARLEDLRLEDGALRLFGHAYVSALGAGGPESQRVSIAAVRPGRLRPLRLRVASRRLPTRPAKRPDLEPDLTWSGFRTAIRADDVAADGDATRWDVFAYVRTGLIRRRRARFDVDRPACAELEAPDGALVRAVATAAGTVSVTVHRSWLRIESRRVVDGPAIELGGSAAGSPGELELVRARGRRTLRCPLELRDGTFTVTVPLDELRGDGEEAEWALACGRAPVVLARGLDGARWRSGGSELSLARSASGAPLLTEHALTPVPSAPRALLERDALEHVGDPLAGVD